MKIKDITLTLAPKEIDAICSALYFRVKEQLDKSCCRAEFFQTVDELRGDEDYALPRQYALLRWLSINTGDDEPSSWEILMMDLNKLPDECEEHCHPQHTAEKEVS